MYHSMFTAQQIIFIALLYAPAMAANMAPVFATKYNLFMWLNRAVDMGIQFRGKRLLGENKTLRGFFVGALSAMIVAALISFFVDAKPYDSFTTAITYGVATGLGALVGDSIKSFFKRRVGIKSGELWIPFDQIDFVIGATIVGIFFVPISFTIFFSAIICIGLLSYVVSKIGFALHIKKNL